MMLPGAALVIVTTLLALAAATAWLRRRYPPDPTSLVDAVDALLPQTQCAQCGYAGCRPYAEAVVQGAALNLCPPGGDEVHQALAELLRNSEAGEPPAPATTLKAVIDETQCIGCALCLPACPVDAIVGAPTLMHTVLDADCTGCELCVEPCPVDCISMVEQPPAAPQLHRRHDRFAQAQHGCISCQRCDEPCPEHLPVMTLLHLVERGRLQEARQAGLQDCIDCSLCDRVCPSQIPLARLFVLAQHELDQAAEAARIQQRYKSRYIAHTARLEEARQAADARRAARLAGKRSWR